MLIDTRINDFKIRFAERKDTALILEFIKGLAEYEQMLDDVIATVELMDKNLFDRKLAQVIIGEYHNEPVAFALFFHNFSTFLGKGGIYLEDLYVLPHMRDKGFGKTMISYLAKLTLERECGRLEWACLDWNEPSINFYKSLGATSMDEWTTYRATGQSLENMARSF